MKPRTGRSEEARMGRYTWSRLNHLQVGRFAEYFVKMEFALYGFQVYSAEVDDRGIDFIVRHDSGGFFEIQVKSIRGLNYIGSSRFLVGNFRPGNAQLPSVFRGKPSSPCGENLSCFRDGKIQDPPRPVSLSRLRTPSEGPRPLR